MDTTRTLLLMGGGGHAAVVADAARAAGWTIAGCLDDAADAAATAAVGLLHLGAIDDLARVRVDIDPAAFVHAAHGDPDLRRRWLERVPPDAAATVVHPTAVVSPSARLDAGVFVGPLAIVNARATLETGVIVNSGAIVEHDGHLGAYTHVAPGSVLAGSVKVGPACLIG
ncbi:MAG: carbonic anhydrase, partial [Phycisphaerae bacterium]|nr:carbonic anhydrase [Phycisphaerae bacterium]